LNVVAGLLGCAAATLPFLLSRLMQSASFPSASVLGFTPLFVCIRVHSWQTSFLDDERFMREAIALARAAEAAGEVPVGAVVVSGEEIIGRGSNCPISHVDPTAHAEMLALREASASTGNYRLENSTLYVTLEPCVMCAGALVAARLQRLVFGTRDLRFGGVRSKFRIADSELLNHRVEIVEGVLATECVELMRRFFEARRP
jgi:tRNA(adenine34) deaminase